MAKVTGVIQIKVDGSRQRVVDTPTINFGGLEGEAVVGDAYHGEMYKVVAGLITCNLAHMSDTDIAAMQAWQSVTVEFITDTGITYVLTGAAVVNTLEVNEGKIEVQFRSGPATEV